MTDLRKAAEMALEALDGGAFGGYRDMVVETLRQALAQPEQEPVAWMYEWNDQKHLTFTDQSFVEKAHPHFNKSTPLYTAPVDAVNISQERVDETAKGEHEPVWSTEECDRVMKTLRYIQGIAERGEGRAMRDDETLEQFVLGYVKKLERQEWDGPTDEEYENFCSLIQREEAKLKEKNGG